MFRADEDYRRVGFVQQQRRGALISVKGAQQATALRACEALEDRSQALSRQTPAARQWNPLASSAYLSEHVVRR
jgi:hypothetical protein